MKDSLMSWYKKPELESLLPKLEQWFDGDRGRQLLACQQQMINDVLGQYFGYHLLQLSVDSRLKLYEDCRVQQKYRCHPFMSSDIHLGLEARVSIVSSYEQLPFDSESLDVVLLHHVQDFVDNPHQLLREIQRIVVPHGHLVIIGFNPYSPLGVSSILKRWLPHSTWHNRLLTSSRLKEWLSLLGFETELRYFGNHSPPMLEAGDKVWLKQGLKNWPLGNFYIISAIKQVASLTPSKPRWASASNGFVGLSPIKPRVTSSHSGRYGNNK